MGSVLGTSSLNAQQSVPLTAQYLKSLNNDTKISRPKSFSLEAQRLNSSGESSSDAHFLTEIKINDKQVTSQSISNQTPLELTGEIQSAPDDIGKKADLIVVALYDGVFYMKSQTGWQAWDGQLDHLTALKTLSSLKSVENIEVVSHFSQAGYYKFYLAYRIEGNVHHTKQGFDLHIYEGLVDDAKSTQLRSTSLSLPEGGPLANTAKFSGQFVSNHQVLTGNSFK